LWGNSFDDTDYEAHCKCAVSVKLVRDEIFSSFLFLLFLETNDKLINRGRYRQCESCDYARSNCLQNLEIS